MGDKRESLHVQMEGTEVPNPWRSSACVCCLTTNDHSAASSVLVPPLAIALPRDSLMFAMRIVLFHLCKVRSQVSDALSQALCNLSLAFLADF